MSALPDVEWILRPLSRVVLPSVTDFTIRLDVRPFAKMVAEHLMWETLDDVLIRSLPNLMHLSIAFGAAGATVQAVHVEPPLLRAIEATVRTWLSVTVRRAQLCAISSKGNRWSD